MVQKSRVKPTGKLDGMSSTVCLRKTFMKGDRSRKVDVEYCGGFQRALHSRRDEGF